MLNLVPDDGGRADLKTSAGNGHRVDPAGIAEFVHQRRVAGFRLLAQQAGDDGTVGAMPPAGGTETAVEVRLDGDGRLHEIGTVFQSGTEIGRDPQGRDCVGTGWSRPDLEQIPQGNGNRSGGNPLVAPFWRYWKDVAGDTSGERDIGPRQQFETRRREPSERDEPTPIHDAPTFKNARYAPERAIGTASLAMSLSLVS